MSNRYALRCLSIDQLLCLVKFFFEVRIPYRIIFNQVNITVKEVFQCEFEVKIVVSIFHEGQRVTVKNDGKVDQVQNPVLKK